MSLSQRPVEMSRGIDLPKLMELAPGKNKACYLEKNARRDGDKRRSPCYQKLIHNVSHSLQVNLSGPPEEKMRAAIKHSERTILVFIVLYSSLCENLGKKASLFTGASIK